MFPVSRLVLMRSLAQLQHSRKYEFHSTFTLLLLTCIRGIMRITVTVVVIMFELTGALTYILPTMVSCV